MNETDIDRLAKSWLEYWHAPEGSPERDALFWVNEREWELVESAPLAAWDLVLRILALDSSDRIQEVLAAGPLEDLLSRHGTTCIGTVETRARSDVMFAKLLGGVWRSSMTDEVWSRVQAVWDRRGWDGNAGA